jgi:hypothetical protein
MRNSTKLAVMLALILVTIMIAAAGTNYNSAAGAAALPFAGTNGNETPVRATRGDRLDSGLEIRRIAGVSVVLRDFSQTVR